MCYLIAKDRDGHGCYALKTKHGQHLVEIKRELNKAVGLKGIQIVTNKKWGPQEIDGKCSMDDFISKVFPCLQDNYNYRKHGHKVLIIKPLIDLKGGNTVVNRTNEFAPVDILLANDESIFDDKYLPLIKGTEVILVDEAQFLTEKQIIEFWMLAHKIGITVICYALKSDFKGRLFKGTQALIGFADRKNELTVNCRCGDTAVFNARMVNGNFVFDGDEVAIVLLAGVTVADGEILVAAVVAEAVTDAVVEV